jgi:hypothetical protein
MRSLVRISSWSFAGHAGIAGNETADQYAKDAAMPKNEAELPSHTDRCTSLSHLTRCTIEAKWKRSNDWFQHKSRGILTIRLAGNSSGEGTR